MCFSILPCFYYACFISRNKFWVLQLLFATKILLHATHATTNSCSCLNKSHTTFTCMRHMQL